MTQKFAMAEGKENASEDPEDKINAPTNKRKSGEEAPSFLTKKSKNQ